jgi:HEAT repeat protein
LAAELINASDAERPAVLDKLRDGKGPDFTEALAAAIVRLEGEAKSQARDALSRRLTRMNAETLAEYLKDEEPEVRRAAALACGRKGLKVQIPALIALLRDRQPIVARAAHASLKALTGQRFDSSPAVWEDWWKFHARD